MSKCGGSVDWFGTKALVSVGNATDELLTKIAMQALNHARVNLRETGRVDTGFLINSGYVTPAEGQDVPGEYGYSPDAVEGRSVASQSDAPPNGAVVGFAAEYALWQELKKSYLVAGVEAAAKDVGRIAKTIGKG